jgi:hypothetical protein
MTLCTVHGIFNEPNISEIFPITIMKRGRGGDLPSLTQQIELASITAHNGLISAFLKGQMTRILAPTYT